MHTVLRAPSCPHRLCLPFHLPASFSAGDAAAFSPSSMPSLRGSTTQLCMSQVCVKGHEHKHVTLNTTIQQNQCNTHAQIDVWSLFNIYTIHMHIYVYICICKYICMQYTHTYISKHTHTHTHTYIHTD